MSTLKEEKYLFLKDILKNYFSTKEVTEFTKKYLVPPVKKQVSKSADKKQIDLELHDSVRFRSDVDLLVTFAESKLTESKFLELLLSLGQFTIAAGEFTLSIDLHEKLLNETKNKTEYLTLNAHAYLFYLR